MIAAKFGQDPRDVAEWEPEWLAAATTWMSAESGAAEEIQRRRRRRSKMKRPGA